MEVSNGIAHIENRITFQVLETEESKKEEIVIPLSVVRKSSVLKEMVAKIGGSAGDSALTIKGFASDTVRHVIGACSRELCNLSSYLGRHGLSAEETIQLLRFFREFEFTAELEKLSTYHRHLKMRLAVMNSDVEMANLSVSSLAELIRGATPFEKEIDLLQEISKWIANAKLKENSCVESWDSCWEILKNIRFDLVSPVEFSSVLLSWEVASEWKEIEDYFIAQMYDPEYLPDVDFMKGVRDRMESMITLPSTAEAFSIEKDWKQHSSVLTITPLKSDLHILTFCLRGTKRDSEFMEVEIIVKGPEDNQNGDGLEIYHLSRNVRVQKDQPIVVEAGKPVLLLLNMTYRIEVKTEQSGSSLYDCYTKPYKPAEYDYSTIYRTTPASYTNMKAYSDENVKIAMETDSSVASMYYCTKLWWISYSVAAQ